MFSEIGGIFKEVFSLVVIAIIHPIIITASYVRYFMYCIIGKRNYIEDYLSGLLWIFCFL